MANRGSSVGLRLLTCLIGLAATPGAARALDQPLVLARQQSAFAHDSLGGGPLVVTYWLFNSGNEALGEPLIATTLAPGVTLEAADPPAMTRGQDVVVPLPAVSAGAWGLATLTLRVPPGVLAVDGGARAFADTRTRQVSGSLPPTTLRTTLGADPALLASTPEAPAGATTSSSHDRARRLRCGRALRLRPRPDRDGRLPRVAPRGARYALDGRGERPRSVEPARRAPPRVRRARPLRERHAVGGAGAGAHPRHVRGPRATRRRRASTSRRSGRRSRAT